MLVTDAHLDFQVQGGLDLTLEDKTDPQHPQACLMHLQVSLVHGLVHLMAQAAEKAQWGLDAGPEPAPDNPTATNAAPTRYAH
jgi:hypothetical protein